MVLIFGASCLGQEKDKSNAFEFDFFKSLDVRNLSVGVVSSKTSDIKKMYIPYYEFNHANFKPGSGCLFAISKTFPEIWTKSLTKKCSENESAYGKIVCQAKHIFSADTISLKREMDIYFFLVDKNELEGPFLEEAEGGRVENFYPKIGSTYLIYKYENHGWKEIDRIKQDGDKIPRNFGMEYIKRIGVERIGK